MKASYMFINRQMTKKMWQTYIYREKVLLMSNVKKSKEIVD